MNFEPLWVCISPPTRDLSHCSAPTTTTSTTTTTTTTTTSTTTVPLSYTYTLPDGHHVFGTDIKDGATVQISTACEPNYVGQDSWHDCDYHVKYNHCDDPFRLIFTARVNSDGILETGLSCPEWGCGANGARDINDI